MIFYGKMEASLFMVTTNQLISEIKNSVSIVDVIGEVVQLTKAGRLLRTHGEKTPSFNGRINNSIIVWLWSLRCF